MRLATPSPRTLTVAGAVAEAVKIRAEQVAHENGIVPGTIGAHGLAVFFKKPEHDPFPALPGLLLGVEWPAAATGEGDHDSSDVRDSPISFRVCREIKDALLDYRRTHGVYESAVIAHVFAVELDMPDYDPFVKLARKRQKKQVEEVWQLAM